jgi:hypothetical protein
MAIIVATFWNWKPKVNKEKRENLMKRGQELAEKYDFKQLVLYASTAAGSKYNYVNIAEYPNYAFLDKVMETPELNNWLSECLANIKDVYRMMFRTIPIP